ncbi:MAG: tRNA (N6-isopentenyl adenosine(37)-C2)-methylthiotransferase MiaB [Myxococcales bacterium]|nr:tRNA (N6-isopentenyl adenosine(37)-C2)-methylthiotransferase MiaB [Myxococcales bacterium]MCB9716112.1 tRNA (N6-isopentenyl adenosine(37)-C2)-methylthiotransferase MiaB [Myxococcales bacterium]
MAPSDAPRVYLETFGCQMNEADSALIAGRLREGGYVRVADPGEADVVLINTCAIREKAEDRVIGRTSQLLMHRRSNPDLVIGITGCMAEHLKSKVAERAPHITLVAGPDSYRGIAELVDRARHGERVVDVKLDKAEVYEGLSEAPQDDGVSAFVTVQRGCDKFCTFCVVPFTRGRERGVPPREVLRAVRARAAAGYREVVLLGQTVNSYRHEDVGFAELLAAVHEVEGIERIRFTSPYPVDFSDALLHAMGRLPKVMPQVHLPAQSGSNAVLERMRRGYTREHFLELVARLREAVPGIALSTDLMVGFCGETEDEHAQTLSLMEELRFDSAFMFAYSDRGITYAAKRLEDDVPEATKKRRLSEVIELQERHTRASHERELGREATVLITGPSRRGDRLVGKTPRFHKVLLPLGAGRPGDLVEVVVTGSTGHSLHARLRA